MVTLRKGPSIVVSGDRIDHVETKEPEVFFFQNLIKMKIPNAGLPEIVRREEVSTAQRLEQSRDVALVVDVNQLRRGSCRQTWHSHDISRNGNQETGT